jgi:tetratricopeptide (TPR) repeat protein
MMICAERGRIEQRRAWRGRAGHASHTAGVEGDIMRTVTAAIATLMVVISQPIAAEGGYGHVEFANSGAPAAQADFLEGLALLHNFEYPAAAAAFRRAQAMDPGFAMAYWGEAMTYNHPIWMQQNPNLARAALGTLAPGRADRRAKAGTDREKAYLDAVETLYGEGTKAERDVRYEAAMAKLHQQYPDDVDATAFYALSILGTAHAGRDVATYMRAAGMLEEAWIDHREHPGVLHYLIHAYDDPTHAPLGLRAARIYARIAPDAGHAQHMTSHIFLALGMWQETVTANIAAIAAVDRMRRSAGKEHSGCGHYPSWLSYAYLQLGQADDARQALEACRRTAERLVATEGPSHDLDPDESMTSSYANMRLRYLLDSGDWNGAAAGWSVPGNAGPGARLDFAVARGFREIALGRIAEARAALNDLDLVVREVVDAATRSGNPDPSYRIRPEILRLEVRGLLAEQEKDLVGAEKLLRQAVAREATLPIAFGPPVIDKPTHELLGEFLLRQGRRTEASKEFALALALTPGRRMAERGLSAAASH